jgi:hypothetical protein
MTSRSIPFQSNAATRHAGRELPAGLRVGITGHRRHRLRVQDDALLQRILDVIELLRRAGRLRSAGYIKIVSALAEGADEIAARAALMAGCRLTALVPFRPKDYETTFSNFEHKAVFRDLLRKADERVVLSGSLRDANAGYVAAGLETLNRSDVVLTLWDGAPAQGRGGTPEILQCALERRLPIIWIDATKDRAPSLLQRSSFGPCPRLSNIARRAQGLHLRNLAKVCSAIQEKLTMAALSGSGQA